MPTRHPLPVMPSKQARPSGPGALDERRDSKHESPFHDGPWSVRRSMSRERLADRKR
jgi:hypothetical protein